MRQVYASWAESKVGSSGKELSVELNENFFFPFLFSGLVVYIVTNIYHLACCCLKSSPKRKIYQSLTLREIEYLEYIKTRDLAQYGDILRELQDFRKSGNTEDYEVVVELEKYISSLSGKKKWQRELDLKPWLNQYMTYMFIENISSFF